MPAAKTRFMVLTYRVPANPTAARVAVWRQLKKVGAIYLQQSVCAFPDNSTVKRDLAPILARITESSGEYHLLPLRRLDQTEEAKLIRQFLEQTSNHYQEIIENCEVNFTKEIEFEIFRKNFTYEEAEEIRLEFEKIRVWFERVNQRDWFGASNRTQALEWLGKCERMLEDFEARVFEVQEKAATHLAHKSTRKRSGGKSNATTTPRGKRSPASDVTPAATLRRGAKILPMHQRGNSSL
jgi:hypothetical protein